MKIFIDSSALIAYYNMDDLHHKQASQVFQRIERGEVPLTRLFTTDYVFDETVTFMECVLNQHKLAVDVGEAILTSPFTTQVRVNEEHVREAWRYFREHKGYSFTDCTSFTIMKEFGIVYAFTFDKHFKEAGFRILH